MKNVLTTLFIVISITTYGQSNFCYQRDFKTILAKTKESKDVLCYDKLLTKFNKNDTTMTDYEVLALLIGFTDKPEYKPYIDLNTERTLTKINNQEKYQEALIKIDSFLISHPVNVKCLYEKAYAFYKLGQSDSSNFYLNKGRKIIRAMTYSGHGQTIDNPIFALGPADGQVYIYKNVASKIGIMGSGNDKNGDFIDILEAKLKDDTSLTLYFIIQHATDKMFDGKSIEDALKEVEKKDKDSAK